MTREDPKLLPICHFCGEYKGVGICKNPSCSESVLGIGEGHPIESDSKNQSCSFCKKKSIVSCVRCGRSFCQTHSEGVDLTRLGSLHQRLGTCVECKQVVCDSCWIFNPNGDILCLTHLEEKSETQGFH